MQHLPGRTLQKYYQHLSDELDLRGVSFWPGFHWRRKRVHDVSQWSHAESRESLVQRVPARIPNDRRNHLQQNDNIVFVC